MDSFSGETQKQSALFAVTIRMVVDVSAER
jgi:hypothetical protein